MVKRITTDEDYERIADNLNLQFGDVIEDKKTFERSYDEYMTGAEGDAVKTPAFRTNVFIAFQKLKRFKRAGGRDLDADRRQTAKVVTKDVKEYERAGADNIDLKGFDTKRKKIPARRPSGKTRRAVFFVKGKKQTRTRDTVTGRFVKRS